MFVQLHHLHDEQIVRGSKVVCFSVYEEYYVHINSTCLFIFNMKHLVEIHIEITKMLAFQNSHTIKRILLLPGCPPP